MPRGWTKSNLGTICDKAGGTIRTGPFGSQLHQSDYKTEGIPVVMPKDIIDGKVSTVDIARISEEDANRLSQHRLQVGDIVYGRRGDIGRQALITERENGWLCGTGCLRISLGNSIVLPEFLHYYLRDAQVIEWIYNQAIGATLPNLNTNILRRIPIIYPDIHTQNKIAATLIAYDALIENNTHRIRILEQIMANLYTEWFVHFRFPGHKSVYMQESKWGKLPKGWQVSPIGEAFETIGGGTPSKKRQAYWENGTVVWYTPSDLTASGEMFMFDSSNHTNELGLRNSSARLFPPYCVMMTSRATLGVAAINTTEACTNQGFITCIPNERVSVYQIYFWIKNNIDLIDSLASGATFKEISKSTFRELPFIISDNVISKLFVEFVDPVAKQIENLLLKNQFLRETRDFLLPKLITGEIDLMDIEVVLE